MGKAPTANELYTLSLHDALPIWVQATIRVVAPQGEVLAATGTGESRHDDLAVGLEGEGGGRSEEHTSELQSLTNLVCRLLLEKKRRKSLAWYRSQRVTTRIDRAR